MDGAEAEEAVAIDYVSFVVAEYGTVSIAIEADSYIGSVFKDRSGGVLGVECSAVFIDVDSIWAGGELDDFGTELFEDQRTNVVAGSVGTVDDYL